MLYFVLLLIADYLIYRKIKTKNTHNFNFIAKEVIPVDVDIENSRFNTRQRFLCRKGCILGLYGPPETGKTTLIELMLKQVKNPL